jgi:hypothetical protein
MTHFTPITSAIGGMLIGLSATIVLAVHGKVAGISGLYGGLFQRTLQDRDFRLAFVLGLFAGGVIMLFARPSSFPSSASHLPVWAIVGAGLLVGYGTRLGNGCTSGHGVCGLSRFSGRSLVATMTFMFTGALTAFLAYRVGGLG